MINDYGLKEMREVSIAASSDDLRTLAEFLANAADDVDNAESCHWHKHVPDSLCRVLGCDIIVLKGGATSDN
ncbi:MAG: hypothetical protein V3R99_08395 [Thermoguttaceae bacterium]